MEFHIGVRLLDRVPCMYVIKSNSAIKRAGTPQRQHSGQGWSHQESYTSMLLFELKQREVVYVRNKFGHPDILPILFQSVRAEES